MVRQPGTAPQQQQFTFVGGPILKKEATQLRSNIARRALAEKRSQKWLDTAKKLNSILKQRESSTDQCTCPPAAVSGEGVERPYPDLMAIAPPGSRVPLLINNPSDTSRRQLLPAQSNRCLTCGRLQQPLASSVVAPSALRPSILGTYRSNPFLPMDAVAAELKVTELLDFAATTIWPHFRPMDYTGNGYRSWAFPMEDKIQLYAVLYASSYHRDALRLMYGAEDPVLDSKEQLEIRGRALSTLRMEVAKLSEPTSPTRPFDGVIMCILYLAVNELHKGRMARDRSLFTPPFIALQALDVYGGRMYHPLHWNTMQEIIRRSGGIEKIATPRLKWLLSLSDLFGAFQDIRKPLYPMMTVTGRRLDLQPPGLLFQPHGYRDASTNTSAVLFAPPSSSTAPGSRFQELSSRWPPLKQDIVTVFIHLGEYSAVAQHYASAKTKCTDKILDLLGDSRNLIHHRLLSLPDESDHISELIFDLELPHHQTGDQDQYERLLSQQIYHTCRLSALLYALHATFPIPRFRAPAQSVLSALYPRIEWLRAHNVSRPVLVWCVAVMLSVLGDEGGPGSEYASQSEVLIEYMASMVARVEVDSVPALAAFLRSFAWVDVAVGDGWRDLWERLLRRTNDRPYITLQCR
ncbi:hypothetical protein BJY01DRAFT_28966 [Aspergillus pseudoustus]|uniref:Fungal-specific transcription factor domain-containing protein n=1 Tax=Aspergillus pseudoustus TaxID=1810923 RepID=A0ABR4JGM8_9EURO